MSRTCPLLFRYISCLYFYLGIIFRESRIKGPGWMPQRISSPSPEFLNSPGVTASALMKRSWRREGPLNPTSRAVSRIVADSSRSDPCPACEKPLEIPGTEAYVPGDLVQRWLRRGVQIQVANSFLDAVIIGKDFVHGYTIRGNPAVCHPILAEYLGAVGLASRTERGYHH